MAPTLAQQCAQQLLRIYQQYFSWDHRWRWVFGGARICRYYPSCSEYMRQGIQRFGVLRGSALGLGRLLRCAPWSTGGVDDVPTTLL